VFDALAHLVLGESRAAPVVVVVEDLHWIDPASRELLEALVRQFQTARVLVVFTHRPDGDPALTVAGALDPLVLERLDAAEITAILRAVAGGRLPDELETMLVHKSGGSPFCAEELVRGLLEAGHLEPGEDGMRLVRPLDEIPIPGTIQEVVAARIDRLPPDAKHVVQVAAVLGRQFTRADLAALLADEATDVAAALEELLARGILHGKSGLGADELRFGESLTQEVAYESLLLRQRRLLHERIARALDARAGGGAERSAVRAHHWARTDDRARAAVALLEAGRDAEAVPSYRVAADFHRHAWEAGEAAYAEHADDRHLRIALEAAGAYVRLVVQFGFPLTDDVVRAAERGRDLAEQLHDNEALAGFFYWLGAIAIQRDDRDFARASRSPSAASGSRRRRGSGSPPPASCAASPCSTSSTDASRTRASASIRCSPFWTRPRIGRSRAIST